MTRHGTARTAARFVRLFISAVGWLLAAWGADSLSGVTARAAAHIEARAKAHETALLIAAGVITTKDIPHG